MLRCPVCHKPLSAREHSEAMQRLGVKEQLWTRRQSELESKLKETRQRVSTARKAGERAGHAMAQRLMAGKDKQLRTLQERLSQLKRGTTPQAEGIVLEAHLVKELRRRFPSDEIEHKGQGGDVLHLVRLGDKQIGVIVYECKRTPRISDHHVRQARRASKERDANFCVLVTTGRRKGFAGLARDGDVVVVSPEGAVIVAELLRETLMEMERARIGKGKRAHVAARMLDFVTSAQFTRPVEQLVGRARDLRNLLDVEMQGHQKIWRKRFDHYASIHWDAGALRENVRLVASGKQARLAQRPSPKERVHSRTLQPVAGKTRALLSAPRLESVTSP